MAECVRLFRETPNCVLTQSDRIALAALCQLDDLFCNHFGCGIGTVFQAQCAQGLFVRGGKHLDLIRSKGMIFEQAISPSAAPDWLS
jgi:hypothetical protein